MKKTVGTPIIKSGNNHCEYFIDSIKIGSKKNDTVKFPMCCCPIRNVFLKENNHTLIIRCPKDFNECEIFKLENKDDIEIVGSFVNINNVDGWVSMSDDDYNDVLECLSINNDTYFNDLMNYHHYFVVKDDNVDGILYKLITG